MIQAVVTGTQGLAGRVWYEHRAVILLAGAYLIGAGTFLTWQGRHWHLFFVYPFVWQMWFVMTVLWCFWQYLRSPKRVKAILEPERILGSLIVVSLVAPFQSTFQSLKRAIPSFTWDPAFSRLDVALHGSAPWTWWVPSDDALWWMDKAYQIWFLQIIGFLVWVSWTSDRRLRAQALLATILLWVVAGTVMAHLLASAGPIFYGRVVEGVDPYSRLSQRIQTSVIVANGVQQRLWRVRHDGTFAPFSGISAMPSMHVAMAVLMAIVIARRWRVAGACSWFYVLVVQVGSVVLAWHYAIDGYVGAVTAVGCWVIAGRATAWLARSADENDHQTTRSAEHPQAASDSGVPVSL